MSALGFAVGLTAPPGAARAQPFATRDRPSEQRLPLPRFDTTQQQSERVLPRVLPPEGPGLDAALDGTRFFSRGYRFTGNAAISTEALQAIAEPFTNRIVGYRDLERLRDAVTHAYVEAGFWSSGAWIPDQRVDDGIVEIRIVEGRLGHLDIDTRGRLRPDYVRDRISGVADGPLNVVAVEEQLQLLRQDPLIASLDARLTPGSERGVGDLEIRVDEVSPFSVFLSFDNHEPPTVGEAALHGQLGIRDPSGFGDSATIDFSFTEGLRDVSLDWIGPLPGLATLAGIHVRYGTSKVVEEPFDDLDIESRSFTGGFRVEQPLWRDLHDDIRLIGLAEWRRTSTSLLGSPFSFVAGPEDGDSTVAVLRVGPEWIHRGPDQVFAARSTVSIGLDLLGATIHSGDAPDGRFLSWLTQLQWAHRLPLPMPGSEVIARLDSQVSDGPLLGLEQFALGGRYTVRGYREDLVVRDGAVIGSLELRVPVLRRAEESPLLTLAPFIDAAYGWNEDRESFGPSTLVGAGIGARIALTRWARFEVYWAKELVEVESSPDWSLQGEGIHAQLAIELH